MKVEDRELGPLLREAARQAAVDNMPVRANTLTRAATIAEENDDLRARLAAAEAREARLVGALDRIARQDQCDGLSGNPAMWPTTIARAALTTDGSALAQAIEGWLTADERERKARGTVSDDEAHDSALQALDAAGDALRAAWRGA